MLGRTITAATAGIEGNAVIVEVDVTRGLPGFNVVGLGDMAVKEAAERVRGAIINSGFQYPKNRITINLAPAYLHKKGSHYDLAMAVGILSAEPEKSGWNEKIFADSAFIGELALDGTVFPVKGVLPMVQALVNFQGQGREKGGKDLVKRIFLPEKNCSEGFLGTENSGCDIISVRNLKEAVDYIKGKKYTPYREAESAVSAADFPDFADVRGQEGVKAAIVTAVSGKHGILMVGPPGTGKTMIAKRIPGILPPMTAKERFETTMVYSVAGLLNKDRPAVLERPFRNLNCGITPVTLLGGGNCPYPGEVSLAHNGVLFLDEFLEMGSPQIEALRQPMEEKKVYIFRRGQVYKFPADFMLVGAANPCKCGYLGDDNHSCTCTQGQIDRYRSRLSGPIADRIDMYLEINWVNYRELGETNTMTSNEMGEKIIRARGIQQERFKKGTIEYNSQMEERHLKEFCPLGSSEKNFMRDVYNKYHISPRRYNKLIKVARTIADVEESRDIQVYHLAAAFNYTKYFNNEERA